jgi:CRISPR/Cas system CSM-associated protein Csm3 (group 7 of RAMP superfamily)
MHIKILLTVKEPLSVGLESIGIKTLLYKIPIVQRNGELFEIPIIPGNSFRGVLRDTMAKRYILDICGQCSGQEKIEIDPGTALSMFSGGMLTRAGSSTVESVPSLIEEYAQYILPLSILGFAVSNTIVPGKIKVGCGYPIVDETKDLIEDIYWEDTKIKLEDLYTEVLLTRKDDIEKISQISEIDYDEEKANQYLQRESEEAGALQQRMVREAVIPGTKYVTYIRDVLPLKPAEEGFLLKTLQEIKSLGGSTARGLGEIELSVLNVNDIDNKIQAYEKFIQDNLDTIKDQLKTSPTDL